MEPENLEKVKEIAQELLNQIGISGQASVSEKDGAVMVTIETEEAGILIGYHGKNLESFQIVLGQLCFRRLGVWVRVVVNVGDYIERRNEQLEQLAFDSAKQAVETSGPITLADLSASERRIVHMALVNHPEVESQSEGEGKMRHLVIKPKVM